MQSCAPKATDYAQQGNSCAACTLAMVLHETGKRPTNTPGEWTALYYEIWNKARFYSGDAIAKAIPPGGSKTYYALQNTNPYRLVREARRNGLKARLCLSSQSEAMLAHDPTLSGLLSGLKSGFEGGGAKHRRTKDVNLEAEEGLDLIAGTGLGYTYASIVCTMIESGTPTGMHNVLVKYTGSAYEVYDSNASTRSWTPVKKVPTAGWSFGAKIATPCGYKLVYLGLSVVM